MQRNDGGQQPEGRVVTTTPSIAALSAIPNTHPAVTQLRVAGRVPVVTATAAIGKNSILWGGWFFGELKVAYVQTF